MMPARLARMDVWRSRRKATGTFMPLGGQLLSKTGTKVTFSHKEWELLSDPLDGQLLIDFFFKFFFNK